MKLIKGVVHVVSPYFLGFLLAYLVNPLVNFLYARIFRDLFKIKAPKLKAGLSIFSAYLIVLGGLILCVSYIVPQLVQSITDLIGRVPDFYNQTTLWLTHYIEKNPSIDSNAMNDFMNNYLPKFQDYLVKQLQNIIPMLYGAGMSVLRFFINFFIAVIVSIYMICDKKLIRNYFKRLSYALLSKEHANGFLLTLKDCNKICKSFFIGKTIDSLIIGALCFVLMSITKLPYAMLISVVVGITNMIPYFGPYIGAVPGLIILFMDKPSHGLIFLLLIIGLQSFDGMILGPKILGDSTGLRPLIILFAISCGGAAAGPLGMFLGVPFFGILSYLLEHFINHQLSVKQVDEIN